jgi:hypothetical protein
LCCVDRLSRHLNNGHSPKGRLRQLCADTVAKVFFG